MPDDMYITLYILYIHIVYYIVVYTMFMMLTAGYIEKYEPTRRVCTFACDDDDATLVHSAFATAASIFCEYYKYM